MREQTTDKPSLVPFPRVLAVLGFTVFSAVAILFLLESGAGVVYHVARYRASPLRRLQASSPPNTYPCRGTGNGDCSMFGDAYLNSTSARMLMSRWRAVSRVRLMGIEGWLLVSRIPIAEAPVEDGDDEHKEESAA